ncbi:MAG TPA: FlgD immunoglobulin-like domain containing protein [Bacteroidia bacterium]|jgi:hypothetical protein
MKKLYSSLLLLVLFAAGTQAQTEWKDVASIFYARCTSCHHPGGQPQPKYTCYSLTYPWVAAIQSDLTIGKMPPWSPDTTYSRFLHERIITASEKNAILNWISNGAQMGDTTQAPVAPTYPQYQLYGTPTLTLQIPTFTSNANSNDSYVCFSLPTGLTQDLILRAYEIVPGDPSIVHHVVVNVDTTGTVQSDLSGSCFTEPGQFSIGGYAPGAPPTVFPGTSLLKAGIRIKAGSNLILQIHYPVGTGGMQDSTKIRLYFYPPNTTGVRQIYVNVPLQNWNLYIPANTTQTFTAKYPSGNNTLPASLSMFGTFPHSHKICTQITNYAYTSTDTIPLVRINNWDFNWQGYYTFRNLVKVPAGYKLFSSHLYDNTTNNPNVTNPQLVIAGTSTSDEMLFDGYQYLLYQPGDELIDLDSLMRGDSLLAVKPHTVQKNLYPFAFPNPFSDKVNISYTLEWPASTTISVYNMYGALVKTLRMGNQQPGPFTVEWDGTNDAGVELPSGMYFFNITAGDATAGGKLMYMRKK